MAATQTRSKRRFGGYLRDLRERAGRSVAEAAGLLRVNESSVRRYESGHVRPAWQSLQALLPLYGASESEREEAAVLWEDAGERAARVELPAGAPKAYRAFIRTESEADTERVLEAIVVPGLLQTPAYTRAINITGRAFHDPAARVERFVMARRERQKRLSGARPLHLHAVIDEAVIRRVVGGPEVMIEQLEHLLTMGERDNVKIQVIPYEIGAYGTMSGGCTILSFKSPDDEPLVYLEHSAGGATVEQREDVQRFEIMFDEVAASALTPARSATLIHSQMKTLEER